MDASNLPFLLCFAHLTLYSTVIQYIDKPPKGKHSTKGLGKKKPEESDYVKWRDDVTVPCGKPVDSNVRASELMYNEYIVYDTAQVSSKFRSCLSLFFSSAWVSGSF